MNNYTLSELTIGLKHSFTVQIDDHRMRAFLEISGDNNPMHVDSGYAISKGMNDRVVYGMLTSTFYSTLVGVYLPGKFALLHTIDIQFLKPVYIGDKLTVTGELISINALFSQIELKAHIVNQRSEKISRAKIKIGIINE